MESFIEDCDTRTRLSKERLKESQQDNSPEVAAMLKSIDELTMKIDDLLGEVQLLGANGEVLKSLELMDDVDKLRHQKKKLENDYRLSLGYSSFQQKKLRVCHICSAYLGVGDDDSRLADHFGGKLHLSFIQLREKLQELRETAGPRQKELKKKGYHKEARFYVGSRDLDRRAEIFRSNSDTRHERKRDYRDDSPEKYRKSRRY